MPRTQLRPIVLSTRQETRLLFGQVVEGCRDCLPIQPAQITRYTQGECANPIEIVTLMLRLLPADRAAQIMVHLEDTYEVAHGADCGTPLEEIWRTLDEADGGEDRVRMRAALSRYSEPELREFLRLSRDQDRAGHRARQAVVRELARRNGTHELARNIRSRSRSTAGAA